jgi:hypothetical protein
MKPELIAASEAAHKAKEADQDDPDYTAFDRTVELGYLVECLGGLCGPHLLLLNEIADALHELHDAEEGHGQVTPPSPLHGPCRAKADEEVCGCTGSFWRG